MRSPLVHLAWFALAASLLAGCAAETGEPEPAPQDPQAPVTEPAPPAVNVGTGTTPKDVYMQFPKGSNDRLTTGGH